MNIKDYFSVGCRLFGVYCLVLSIPTLISFIQLILVPSNLEPELSKIFIATNIATAMVPVCYLAIGFYLIRSRFFLIEFSKLDENNRNNVEPKSLFILFLKFLGMYLIVQFIPDFLKTVSSIWVYHHAPKYLDMFQEKQFVYYNLLSSIAGMSIGVYLLKSGKFFIKLAFKKDAGHLPKTKE